MSKFLHLNSIQPRALYDVHSAILTDGGSLQVTVAEALQKKRRTLRRWGFPWTRMKLGAKHLCTSIGNQPALSSSITVWVLTCLLPDNLNQPGDLPGETSAAFTNSTSLGFRDLTNTDLGFYHGGTGTETDPIFLD